MAELRAAQSAYYRDLDALISIQEKILLHGNRPNQEEIVEMSIGVFTVIETHRHLQCIIRDTGLHIVKSHIPA